MRQHGEEKSHRSLGEAEPQVKFGWSRCPAGHLVLPAGHLALLAKLMRPFIGCRWSANAVTKLDPSANSLSRADSGSITEQDMPNGRPSRLRERPVTAGAIVIPIHFAIVVSPAKTLILSVLVTPVPCLIVLYNCYLIYNIYDVIRKKSRGVDGATPTHPVQEV